MPTYQNKELSGTLFQNDKKTSDKHPDLKGTATINGNTVYVAAWKKMAKNGSEFLSLSFSFPQEHVSAKPWTEPETVLVPDGGTMQKPEDALPF